MSVRSKGKIVKQPTRICFNPTRATIYDPIDPDGFRYMSRNGLYAHFCYEWDEMLIDETDSEFALCKCGCPDERT